jgi:predicted Rossmann fold nucleotide-binding protein DprA/Smf involved in DNA uptake
MKYRHRPSSQSAANNNPDPMPEDRVNRATQSVVIRPTEALYPALLRQHLVDHAPAALFASGRLDLIQTRPLALFCSRKCPGDLIVKTYDLAQKWREQGLTVIGGFHSPMERQCLRILLCSPHPVIICPARGLPRRIEPELKRPLAEGRLLLLSAFPCSIRRVTEDSAYQRNLLAAALAERIFIAYAEPGSRTELFFHKIAAWGKPLFTHPSHATANLIMLGAHPWL